MNRQLHRLESVFSGRHVPSWLLLTAAAGMVNVTAILATEQFVTHLTGTATRLGMSYDALWVAFDFLVVLVFFVFGAMTAGWLLDVRADNGKRPLYSVPLFITSFLIAFVGVGGILGWFGPFGGSIDQPGDFVLLSGLSFAMGLQNGSVATSTGLVVRTTHITGPATDLGLHLAELIFVNGERRAHARRNAALRGGKIAAFILGSAVAVPISTRFGYAAFFVPAVAVLLANISSFVLVDLHEREASKRPERIETSKEPPRPIEQGA